MNSVISTKVHSAALLLIFLQLLMFSPWHLDAHCVQNVALLWSLSLFLILAFSPSVNASELRVQSKIYLFFVSLVPLNDQDSREWAAARSAATVQELNEISPSVYLSTELDRHEGGGRERERERQREERKTAFLYLNVSVEGGVISSCISHHTHRRKAWKEGGRKKKWKKMEEKTKMFSERQ